MLQVNIDRCDATDGVARFSVSLDLARVPLGGRNVAAGDLRIELPRFICGLDADGDVSHMGPVAAFKAGVPSREAWEAARGSRRVGVASNGDPALYHIFEDGPDAVSGTADDLLVILNGEDIPCDGELSFEVECPFACAPADDDTGVCDEKSSFTPVRALARIAGGEEELLLETSFDLELGTEALSPAGGELAAATYFLEGDAPRAQISADEVARLLQSGVDSEARIPVTFENRIIRRGAGGSTADGSAAALPVTIEFSADCLALAAGGAAERLGAGDYEFTELSIGAPASEGEALGSAGELRSAPVCTANGSIALQCRNGESGEWVELGTFELEGPHASSLRCVRFTPSDGGLPTLCGGAEAVALPAGVTGVRLTCESAASAEAIGAICVGACVNPTEHVARLIAPEGTAREVVLASVSSLRVGNGGGSWLETAPSVSAACGVDGDSLATVIAERDAEADAERSTVGHAVASVTFAASEPVEAPAEAPSASFSFRSMDGDLATPLSGARFSLLAWRGAGTAPGTVVDAASPATGWVDAGAAVSGTDGVVDFASLAPGEYRLIETHAPEGCSLPVGQWRIALSPDGSLPIEVTAVAGPDGSQPPAFSMGTSACGEGAWLLPCYASMQIPNSGGVGTAVFLVAGGALAATGLALLGRSRSALCMR